MRIGHGFDVHRFGEAPQGELDPHIMLCGQKIPHHRILLAHSDGDVAIHALCDALLGAIGAGDIGHHFPDSDARFKDIDSCELLLAVLEELKSASWQVGNIDLTVIAQEPKLAPHIPAMREKLAGLLGVNAQCTNIKATTTEGLGYAGRKEGIAAHAVALLVRS